MAARVGGDLDMLARGALRTRPFALRLWDGSELPPSPATEETAATLILRSPRAVEYLAREPNQLGLGRAWVSGALDVEGDIERALEVGGRFDDVHLSPVDRLRALRIVRRLGALHAHAPAPPSSEAHVSRLVEGRRHSPRRDRVAVRHHYDVPGEFYRIVLGPSMVYSCAYFGSREDTLEQAQERKLELICRKLQLAPGERLLDVGCGWGSLVIKAARDYGVRAVGVTLSEPQAEVARRRAREAGVEDRCEIRVADYREVDDGPYDKIASVGMYEHVGRAMLGAYVRRIEALLRPGGLVLNHGIARLKAASPNGKSFIWRYVFPDGELHPVGALIEQMHRVGLEIRDVESLREHYPLTLRRWLANLARERDRAIAIAGAERERIWRMYMSGSALAFDRGEIGVYHTLAARPGAPHRLPLSREQWLLRPGD